MHFINIAAFAVVALLPLLILSSQVPQQQPLDDEIMVSISGAFAQGLDPETIRDVVISQYADRGYDMEFLLTQVPIAINQHVPSALAGTIAAVTSTQDGLSIDEKNEIDKLMTVLDRETIFNLTVNELMAKGRDFDVAVKQVQGYIESQLPISDDEDEDEESLGDEDDENMNVAEDQGRIKKQDQSDRLKLIKEQNEAYARSLAADQLRESNTRTTSAKSSQPEQQVPEAKDAFKVWDDLLESITLQPIKEQPGQKNVTLKIVGEDKIELVNVTDATPLLHIYKLIHQHNICKTPFGLRFPSDPNFKAYPNLSLSWISGSDKQLTVRVMPISEEMEVAHAIFVIRSSLKECFVTAPQRSLDIVDQFISQ